MRGFLANEMKGIRSLLSEERLPAIVLCSSTLFLVSSRYLATSPKILGSLLHYVILPLLVIVLILRRDPLEFGLRAGRWRIWLAHVAVAGTLSILLAVVAARIPAFREFYGGKQGLWPGRAALACVSIFSVEFMFRGFILFGLKSRLGGGAVFVQMVPFALLHLHKPGLETAGCVISGIYFGYVAWRTDSLWPVWIIHCIATLSMMSFAS